MGSCKNLAGSIRGTLFLFIMALSVGCQVAPTVSISKLARHRELADLNGLDPAKVMKELNVSWALPGEWDAMPLRKTALYTHQQWRSPSLATGVGVAHIQLPFAIPAQTVIWFAKNEYLRRTKELAKESKDFNGGELLNQWTDDLGRQWFEAENAKYHVRGYAITKGTQAWIVYWGRRVSKDPQPKELTLATRSLESVVPVE